MSSSGSAARSRAFSPGDPVGVLLLLVGAAACAASFASLPWYSVSGLADSAGQGLLFSDLHANADQLAAPVAASFFDRLAWGLVGVAVVVGLAARAVRAGSAALRVIAFLVAVSGAVLTYYSLAQLLNAQRVAGGSAHGVLHSASSGLYLAFAGYLLMAAGALAGYRHPPPPVVARHRGPAAL